MVQAALRTSPSWKRSSQGRLRSQWWLAILFVMVVASHVADRSSKRGDFSHSLLLVDSILSPLTTGAPPAATPLRNATATPSSPRHIPTAIPTRHQHCNASLRDDLLRVPHMSAERLWAALLQHGSATPAFAGRQVWEVGMHRAMQCLQAAKAGFHAHCVEPSPTSFGNVRRRVASAPADVRSRIHLYHAAAGATSGDHVPFTAMGSTGDHVGHSNVWAMNATHPDAGANVIYVPTLRLDDVVGASDGDRAFLAKIDTQGYEPAVLAGLSESLRSRKIPYILAEYWPRGMDFLLAPPHPNRDPETPACLAAGVLQDLADHGYEIYALPVQAHPRAPPSFFRRPKSQQFPPLDNAMENCRWYYELEHLHPSDVYKVGYWSDVLAVAPGLDLPPALLLPPPPR